MKNEKQDYPIVLNSEITIPDEMSKMGKCDGCGKEERATLLGWTREGTLCNGCDIKRTTPGTGTFTGDYSDRRTFVKGEPDSFGGLGPAISPFGGFGSMRPFGGFGGPISVPTIPPEIALGVLTGDLSTPKCYQDLSGKMICTVKAKKDKKGKKGKKSGSD